jgi:hypothetical protein
LIAIAAFAGPAAGAAGRSQEILVLRPLLRRSTPGLVLDKGPRGGPGGSRAAFEDHAAVGTGDMVGNGEWGESGEWGWGWHGYGDVDADFGCMMYVYGLWTVDLIQLDSMQR